MAEYSPTDWVNGTTPVNEANLEKMEQGIAAAVAKDPVVLAAVRLVASKLLAGDAQPAFRVMGNGQIEWGPGGATAPDTTLLRIGAGILRLGNNSQAARLQMWNALAGTVFDSVAMGESFARFVQTADGAHLWGSGASGTPDTNLYRSAADILKSDDKFDPAALNMPTKAGVPVDGDIVGGAQDGDMVLNTNDKKPYARIGGVWTAVGGGSPGVISVLDYGAVADGTTDCTTAFRNAYLALPATGGTIVVPPGTYKGWFDIDNPAKKVKLSGYGAKIIVPTDQWGVYVHYGSGGDPESTIIEGFYFDAEAFPGATGIGIEGSDRVRIRDVVTWGGEHGIIIGAFVAGQFCEGIQISNCFLRYPAVAGIALFRFGAENTSFGEMVVEDVGIQLGPGPAVGIQIQGDIYRSHFSGVTVFQCNGNSGIVIDGNVYGVSFHGGVESFESGTGQVGIAVGANATNVLASDWNVVFTGNFATKVWCAAGKDLNIRMGNEHRVQGSASGGRGMRLYLGMTEAYARVEIAPSFPGGGGIMFGNGGGFADVQLYRNAAGQLETNAALKVVGGIVGGGGVHYRNMAPVDVVSTAAETNIFSTTLAAALLGTDKVLRITLIGDYLHNVGGGDSGNLKLYFGTAVVTCGITFGGIANANRGTWSAVGYVGALSASSQKLDLTATSRRGDSAQPTVDVAPSSTLGAIDSTLAQTLRASFQWSASSANNSWRTRFVLVELL